MGMLSGADLGTALKGAAIGQGIGFAADAAAPIVNDAVAAGRDFVRDVGLSAYNVDDLFADAPPAPMGDLIKRRGIQVANAGDLSGIVPSQDELFGQIDAALAQPPQPIDPALLDPSLIQAPVFLGEGGMLLPTKPKMPPAQAPSDPTFGGELQETAPGVFEQPPMPDPNRITGSDLKRYASIAKAVYNLLGGEAKATQGAPRPPRPRRGPEGEVLEPTPQEQQEYLNEVVEYLGLDTVAMAQAGLTPGTPEYLDYILTQADSIIGRVLGDANPEGTDFPALLRQKTGEELQALMRALYVRGQLGHKAGPGRYLDPFTGLMEDVAAPEGSAPFLPGVAAWQRGLARSAEELAGMRGQEAKRFLGGLLDREPDLYRMQARRDAQALKEALYSQSPDDDLKRRRRGMLGDEAFFQQELEGQGSLELDRILALLMGRDRGRQGAAVEELFGWGLEEF